MNSIVRTAPNSNGITWEAPAFNKKESLKSVHPVENSEPSRGASPGYGGVPYGGAPGGPQQPAGVPGVPGVPGGYGPPAGYPQRYPPPPGPPAAPNSRPPFSPHQSFVRVEIESVPSSLILNDFSVNLILVPAFISGPGIVPDFDPGLVLNFSLFLTSQAGRDQKCSVKNCVEAVVALVCTIGKPSTSASANTFQTL
ncbi:hypothetical protein EVAR_763_1 [Eumeta japonica]|uniref:Uncharacterized protein n=1 Tax=Eumeta variegata TaxID=151549 RepID=A0A4C1SBV1_EUMVA|nr:hypothetical protein EVAR_763_1 [Eumeta japonica]